MPQDEKLKTIELPEELRVQFGALEQRLLRIETVAAISIGLSALLLSYFLLFVSDRFWDTPASVRLGLMLASTAILAITGFWWVRRWVLKRRDLRALAIIVQRKYRRLGDRLLGIVELAEEKNRPAYFSPELYSAAIKQVAEESNKYNFADAVSNRNTKRDLYVAAGLLTLAVLPSLLVPAAGWNALRRWLMPLGSVPRFTLVDIEGLPAEQVVPHGEDFELAANAVYRSFWHPSKVALRYADQPTFYGLANKELVRLRVPGQIQNGFLRIKFGDAEKRVAIQPTHRPGLTKMEAAVQLPEYLQYPEQTATAQSGSISVVEGSKVALRGEVSRALHAAAVQLGDEALQQLKIENKAFSSAFFNIDGVPKATLTWTDTLGLTNAAPWNLTIESQKDATAVPELPDLFRDTAMLETEVLQIKTRAHDDFGVKMLGLTWVSEASLEASNSVHQSEFKFEAKTPQNKALEQTFTFSPTILHIPEDSTVELRAFALDYFPGRERNETPVFRIHVLGNAKHAEMIRQNLESLLVRLEEITRNEEKIASETRELREAQKADPKQASQKATDLKDAQEQTAANLKEMAEEGMKTLREALRNPAFSEELLTQWTRDLHQMQKIGSEEMKDSSKSLESASQSSESQSRQENLQQAEAKQDQALQQLQEMQKKVNKGLDDLQALTLSQRLRKLSGEEKKLEGNLQKTIGETVGLTPQELPGRFQKANASFAGQQSDTQGESVKLQSEISRFYERTQKQNYGNVSKEMAEAKPGDELDKLRGLIQENIAMEAMQNLAAWSDKFNAWADKLQPEPDKSKGEGGGGEGGGGQNPQEDAALKQLMALLRMRERQASIEHRTGLLNQYIEDKLTYRDGAVLLAASQAKLNRDFTKEAVGNSFAILEASYDEALTSMSDVENLLDKPRTDEVTKTAQDTTIARMSDVINLLNEQAKNGSSSSSSSSQSAISEQMAFLMQMMGQQSQGMQQAQTPGGNNSGGTTDHVDPLKPGNVSGKDSDARTVNKSSGLPQNYPTEFRQALETYFKALEAEQK